MSHPRIGIRREDEGRWERRVPLVPYHARLLRHEGVAVTVQSSPMRAYTDGEYQTAGAAIHENLDACHAIFGVHPPTVESIEPGACYVCMAAVRKRPTTSRALLERLVECESTLIDLAEIRDDQQRSLIDFDRPTGISGSIDALWALGRRLKIESGPTPFLSLRASREYEGIDAMRLAIMQVGRRLAEEGLPAGLGPLAIGCSGTSAAADAARELIELLPTRTVSLDELNALRDGQETEVPPLLRLDLPSGPHDHRYLEALAQLDVLIHAGASGEDAPELVPSEFLRHQWREGQTPRLRVIVDLTREQRDRRDEPYPTTDPDHPVWMFDVESRSVREAWSGRGPLILAPQAPSNEIARDASAYFGQRLLPFASGITWGVHGRRIAFDRLPTVVQRAVVVYRGEWKG
jgi:hypothetical protein